MIANVQILGKLNNEMLNLVRNASACKWRKQLKLYHKRLTMFVIWGQFNGAL